MYNCRNCGGNLRFDIPSQRLKCPYCDSDYDCYEFDSEESSDDKDSYDVTDEILKSMNVDTAKRKELKDADKKRK
jgi:hypothetical protein